jgi:alkanesulfonate monooxygenase SsuD/methylene tetrahydromethanopterin reductase-like flavin-dependent oxidoreductase (luciferase family)
VLGFAVPHFGESARDDVARFAATAAAVTSRVRLGSSVFVAPRVQHEGMRWSIPESWVNLKPVQRPRPSTDLGAFTPPGLKPVGAQADGWMAGVQAPGGMHLKALNWQRGAVDQVAETVRLLADNGYRDAFVDSNAMTGTDAQLEWVERLLTR